MEKLLNILLLNKLKNEKGTTPSGTINITQNGTVNVTNYATADVAVPSGGGEKDVFFYDYDGTLVASYTKDEFLELTELPAQPTHTGLTGGGWNFTLAEAQTAVTQAGKMDIGALYTTSSEKSEFDVDVNSITGLTVTLNMTGNKDWGDGTTDSNTSHTYTTAGSYTITCDGTSLNMYLMGNTDSTYNYTLKEARLKGISEISIGAFWQCMNLKHILLDNSVTTLGNNCFNGCKSLEAVIFPNNIANFGGNVFKLCSNLKLIVFSSSTVGIGSSAFESCINLKHAYISASLIGGDSFKNCYSLKEVYMSDRVASVNTSSFINCYSLEKLKMSNAITSIPPSTCFSNCTALKDLSLSSTLQNIQSQGFLNCSRLKSVIFPASFSRIRADAFSGCVGITTYDFSKASAVVTLDTTSAFAGINPLCKIVVPDSLYSSWITASNWSTYANYIVRASEV